MSGGRDRVVNLWDVQTLQHVRTIPVYESVEAVCVRAGAEAAVPDASSTPKSKSKKKAKTEPAAAAPAGLQIVTAGDKVQENTT